MTTPPTPTLAESWLELPSGGLFWLTGRCTIGRNTDNTLVIDATSVSRHHALLTAEPSGYTLRDLRSSNGTYINRAAVTHHILLQDGDELQLGGVFLRYRCTRRTEIDSAGTHSDRTRRLEEVRERACWLILADIAGFSALNAELGSKAALQRFHDWVAGMRPVIEQHGGIINSYVGDAILAWWPDDTANPEPVCAALVAIEKWRAQSPVPFRVVAHHGIVLFTRTERGEELSGQEVNFVFRSEKIAKSFGSGAMLSEPAARTLRLAGRCTSLGTATVEGIPGHFEFFAAPRMAGSPTVSEPPAQ
jgi:pSer/pThr/pTyr-binding forkhead associated (FHA) protein